MLVTYEMSAPYRKPPVRCPRSRTDSTIRGPARAHRRTVLEENDFAPLIAERVEGLRILRDEIDPDRATIGAAGESSKEDSMETTALSEVSVLVLCLAKPGRPGLNNA